MQFVLFNDVIRNYIIRTGIFRYLKFLNKYSTCNVYSIYIYNMLNTCYRPYTVYRHIVIIRFIYYIKLNGVRGLGGLEFVNEEF